MRNVPSVRRRSELASGALVAVGAVAGAVVMMAGGFGVQRASLPRVLELQGSATHHQPVSGSKSGGSDLGDPKPKIVQHQNQVVSEQSDTEDSSATTSETFPPPTTTGSTTVVIPTTTEAATTTTDGSTTTTTRPKSGGGDDGGDGGNGRGGGDN